MTLLFRPVVRPSLIATFVALAATELSLPVARAAPFDPATVDASARFVAFVDAEAGRKTALGEALLARLADDPNYVEFERMMIEAAGFMPADDIDDVTIYGSGYGRDPQAVMVIRAGVDANRLRTAVGFADAFEAKARDDGRELLSWRDDANDKRVHACIFDAKTIVMADAEAKVSRAVDVLADKGKSLASREDDDAAKKFPAPSDAKTWAFVAGLDVGTSPGAAANAVLSKIGDAVFELAENDGKTVLKLTADAGTAAEADQMMNMANGLKALAAFAAPAVPRDNAAAADGAPAKRPAAAALERKQAEAAVAAELAAATTVARGKGNDVTLTCALASGRAVAIIEDAMDREAQATKR